jgi:glycosyltransferase involved in cell wall biosynthesis
MFISDHFTPKVDGVTTRLTCTINELIKLGHKILLITSVPNNTNDESYNKNFTIIRIPSIQVFFLKNRYLLLSPKLLISELKAFEPDIIHIVNFNLAIFWLHRYTKRFKLPYVISIHTNYTDYLQYYRLNFLKSVVNAVIKLFCNSANLVLTTSNFMQNNILVNNHIASKVWPGAIANFIDMSNFNTPELVVTLRSSGQKILLYVGRLSPEKNISSLLPLLKMHPEITLLIIGNGPSEQSLKQYYFGENVVFLGELQYQEICKYYRSVDLLIMPSKSETLGLVILEAMHNKCPVIGINHGGITSIIEDGVNGMLYDGKNNQDLIRKVEKFFLLPKDILANQIDAAKKYADSMTWQNSTQQLVNFYLEIIKG